MFPDDEIEEELNRLKADKVVSEKTAQIYLEEIRKVQQKSPSESKDISNKEL